MPLVGNETVDGNGTLRQGMSAYAHAKLILGNIDVSGGFGMATLDKTEFDKDNKVNINKMQQNIHGAVQYHVGPITFVGELNLLHHEYHAGQRRRTSASSTWAPTSRTRLTLSEEALGAGAAGAKSFLLCPSLPLRPSSPRPRPPLPSATAPPPSATAPPSEVECSGPSAPRPSPRPSGVERSAYSLPPGGPPRLSAASRSGACTHVLPAAPRQCPLLPAAPAIVPDSAPSGVECSES